MNKGNQTTWVIFFIICTAGMIFTCPYFVKPRPKIKAEHTDWTVISGDSIEILLNLSSEIRFKGIAGFHVKIADSLKVITIIMPCAVDIDSILIVRSEYFSEKFKIKSKRIIFRDVERFLKPNKKY